MSSEPDDELVEEVIDDDEEEVVIDDDDDDEEEEIIVDDDDDDPEDDDATEGGKVITDASAFRAAADDVSALLLKFGGDTRIDLDLVSEMLVAKHRTVGVVRKHFPNSLSCRDAFEKVRTKLLGRGYQPGRIMLAHSVCPDEPVVAAPLAAQGGQHHSLQPDDPCTGCHLTTLLKLFERYLGAGFALGGLAGVPFAGKTGFSSFTHRVPENGHAFVLLAPHVGLDCDNKLGKCAAPDEDNGDDEGGDREEKKASASDSEYCCRAAVNALNYCCSDRPIPTNLNNNPEDYQMNYILQLVNRRKDLLDDDDDENTRQADLAKQLHAIAKNMLDKIVNPFFGGPDTTLLILTGVQINMPKPFEDFFQPRQFYILNKHGKKEDLFKETFGSVQ